MEKGDPMARIHFDVNGSIDSILHALRHGGLFLTTKSGEKINSMVIGWGTIGINWGRPVFTVFVRKGRFTRELLDQNPEFTINVPIEPVDRKIFEICGSKSGRDMDKIEEAHLTPVDGEKISVPGFLELPLTLECKVIYRQEQEYELYPEEIRRNYPQDVDSSYPMANKDEHVTYFGEIVNSYVLTPSEELALEAEKLIDVYKTMSAEDQAGFLAELRKMANDLEKHGEDE